MHLVVMRSDTRNEMKMHDISWPLDITTTGYKNKKVLVVEYRKMFEQDRFRETSIILDTHSGTHIDAPAHFIKDGQSIEHIDLNKVIGPCKVLDLMHIAEAIKAEDLQHVDIVAGDRLLFKTKNSLLAYDAPFEPNFIYVADDAARYLADKKIAAVGIDYLGIERNQPAHETHITLMNAGIVIIEGLRLAPINPGSYMLYCLPLALQGLEGAPARAVLIEE